MDAHVDRRPQLPDVDRVLEVDRSRRLIAGHRAPPAAAPLIGLAVVVTAAQLYGVGLNVGGTAVVGRARQPPPVVRQVSEQPEQYLGRGGDRRGGELVPFRPGHPYSLWPPARAPASDGSQATVRVPWFPARQPLARRCR